MRPLLFWIPMIMALILLPFYLVRMMHHQWSRNELLAFPIADVAGGLISHEKERAWPDIFYNHGFWIGFISILFVYILNGLSRWYPLMVSIPLEFEQRDLVREFPFLANYCGTEAYALFRGWAWPMVIGIAVLLPTDVTLTCWLGNVAMIFGMGFYFLTTGEVVSRFDQRSIYLGMYIAMFAVIIYIGRREYWRALKLAFGSSAGKTPELASAARGCRGFIISFAAVVGLLMFAGLNWFASLFLVAMFSVLVILIARLTAEVGFPWLVNFSRYPGIMTHSFLGSAAIGPAALAIMAVVGLSLNLDTSNTMAAQATTFGKLQEDIRPRRKRIALNVGLLIGVLFTIAATVFFTLWSHYSFGARVDGGIRGTFVGQMDEAAVRINMLRIEGTAERLDAMGPISRLRFIDVDKRFWRFFAYGAAVILICAFMRLRFTMWPIHPLPLLLVSTWGLGRLYHSYFIGWAIKTAMVRIWGGDFYHRSKPFFIGVIMAQIMGGGLWIAVGSIYYLRTGMQPPFWRYFA